MGRVYDTQLSIVGAPRLVTGVFIWLGPGRGGTTVTLRWDTGSHALRGGFASHLIHEIRQGDKVSVGAEGHGEAGKEVVLGLGIRELRIGNIHKARAKRCVSVDVACNVTRFAIHFLEI